uniref:Reverse transcriptase domain-containing protein n=1 Tax=Cacopsylla melanoneura TaxID=428564 RepID=A0A8D9AQU5_9HEMI
MEEATKQINILKEMAERTGLQISFEKTEYLTSVKEAPKQMVTKYGKINRVSKFKYLGEIIEANASDKEGNLLRVRKMETAFQLTRNMYNKKSLSLNAKLRHYNTVIKPECLYASECLVLKIEKQMEDIAKKERKIIRRILGPRYENGIWKLRSNKEVYEKTEKIKDVMKKRRVTFYSHLKRMSEERLTKKIFNYFDKNPKTPIPWFKEVKTDLSEMGITERDILNRNLVRQKIDQFQGFEEKKRTKGGAVWTEERREQHRERMKIYWIQRKEQSSRNRR